MNKDKYEEMNNLIRHSNLVEEMSKIMYELFEKGYTVYEILGRFNSLVYAQAVGSNYDYYLDSLEEKGE